MIRLLASADNGTVILAERDGKYYQVELYWEEDEARGVPPPPEGTQQIFQYDSLELAEKWGNWTIAYDDELPPPDEIIAKVAKTFKDYDAGRGFRRAD